MKSFLFDYTNYGILYVENFPNGSIEKTKWFFTILRACVLDTGVSRLIDSDPLYKVFNNHSIIDNFYVVKLRRGVGIGADNDLNSMFIEKRNRAQLLAPVIAKLVDILCNEVIFAWPNEIGIAVHDTLALEIMNSSPDNDQYSTGILEYAAALNMTPEQAYAEIKLESETFNCYKMRAYTVSKKYQVLIRQIQTKEQATAMINQIEQRLFWDMKI